jgi:hypothetical protein
MGLSDFSLQSKQLRPFTPKPITDIFTNDTSINRRDLRRLVPMKVLILGLGRTGTSSMREAMKQLGYVDTYHMMSASIENPPDALLWRAAFDAKYNNGPAFTRADWDQLLGHCQAVCDWPAIAFASELMAAYPEAKVILTNRDVHSWHASTMKTVYWRVEDWELRWLSYVSWGASLYYPMLRQFFDTFFEGDFEHQGKRIFEKHYQEVRRLVKERDAQLLEFKVQDGWGPLCEFLGVDVPRQAFPHVNDNANFVARSRRRNRMQAANVLFRWFVIALCCLLTWWTLNFVLEALLAL